MFVDGFDPVARLAACRCSRCGSLGLTPTDGDTVAAARPEDQHQPEFTICPSIYARCPACGLVGEWPGMEARED